MTNGKRDDKTQPDLTRIENLSEYLHEENSDLDERFGAHETANSNEAESSELFHEEQVEEDNEEDLPELPELPEDENNFSLTEFDVESDLETNFDFQSESENENTEDIFNNTSELAESKEPKEESKEESKEEPTEETPHFSSFDFRDEAPLQEKFEEVQSFAQNFSYGQIQGGGNPPFSLIIRNVKYSEDAQDILIILKEFGLVTDQNQKEMEKSLEIGSLLVPQIGEFSAIILAHKLRRFDCDLEVGLSDEVHPSKSGDSNPRGLVKKNSLKQNIVESYKKNENDVVLEDIIISTTSNLSGFVVEKYLGVETCFAIIDEDELERLKFVQQSLRSNTQLENYETEDGHDFSSEKAFKDYQSSFDFIYADLCNQLKVKAMKLKANSLLGLNYQLTALPFEKNKYGKNCYQLTCTATLAVVSAESE
jgi:hypothetical protein